MAHVAILLFSGLTTQGAPPPLPPERTDEPPGFLSRAEWDPETPRGVLVNEPEAFDGLTLIQPINSRSAHLIELDGEIVHTWEFDSTPGEWSYLMDDGTLLRSGQEDEDPKFRGGGIGGRVQRIAPDSEVLWHHGMANEDLHSHHDLEPLPNGNLLAIAWTRKTREEAIANGRDPEHVGGAGLWTDAIFELQPQPDGGTKVVWEWHAWDHVVQDHDPDAAHYGDIVNAPQRIDVNGDHRRGRPRTRAEREAEREERAALEALGYAPGIGTAADAETEEEREERRKRLDRSGDWLHTNAVDYDAELDLVVLSVPEFGEVWVIDHSTTTEEARGWEGGRWGKGGDLLYRWGNPSRYGLGGEEDQELTYQHDPKWLRGPDGSLRLTIFDNRAERDDDAPGYSRVIEIVLPFEPERGFLREPDQPFGPTEPVWSYSDPEGFYSAFISGAERLPNGNTLICSGAGGRVFEVTPDGRTVWNYRNPHGGEVEPPEHAGKAPPLALFRAARYPRDHPGIRVLLEGNR